MRVLVVDDRASVRAALVAALEQEDVGAVRAASTPADALDQAGTWKPTAILLEVKRRDGRGLELCRRLRELAPIALLLVVTSYPDPLERLEVIRAGADGYLLKEADPTHLVARIRQAD